MRLARALGARQCCCSGPFSAAARSHQPAGDSTASPSPSCGCHPGSALAHLKSQQNSGKGSGEAQSLWESWPGECFPFPRGHCTVGGSTAQGLPGCPCPLHCPGTVHWHHLCAHLSSPQAVLGDPAGCCSRAAVFPGTETLLINYPKILRPWSKTSLGVSTAELQFPISAPVPARQEQAGGAPYVTCSSQAQMPLQSSEPALHVQREGRSIPLGNKKVSWSFSSPSFRFQPSPGSAHVRNLFQFPVTFFLE